MTHLVEGSKSSHRDVEIDHSIFHIQLFLPSLAFPFVHSSITFPITPGYVLE